MATDAVFVYGTLMPGRVRWELVERQVAAATSARVAGRLYDTGLGFPAAVFDDGAPPIEGWLLELHDGSTDETLALLDRVEGDWYRRVVVRTTDGRSAWSYDWVGPDGSLRPIERWDGV